MARGASACDPNTELAANPTVISPAPSATRLNGKIDRRIVNLGTLRQSHDAAGNPVSPRT